MSAYLVSAGIGFITAFYYGHEIVNYTRSVLFSPEPIIKHKNENENESGNESGYDSETKNVDISNIKQDLQRFQINNEIKQYGKTEKCKIYLEQGNQQRSSGWFY